MRTLSTILLAALTSSPAAARPVGLQPGDPFSSQVEAVSRRLNAGGRREELPSAPSIQESGAVRTDPETGRRVSWTPKTPEGSALTAASLLKAEGLPGLSLEGVSPEDELSSADCGASVVRPLRGQDPISAADSSLLCTVRTKDGKTGTLSLDLSGTPVHRWGNSFYPKGFSFKGAQAEALFDSFARMYAADPDNPRLLHKDVHLASPSGSYDFVDYSVSLDPKNADGGARGPTVMTCTMEFFYPNGEPRPEKPDSLRCDFVYQFEFNGNYD